MPAIEAIIFDLDGTLVRYRGIEYESSWGAIAAAAGVKEASNRLLREYLPRREAYAEWVAKDAALLTGIPVDRVAEQILPAPYARGVQAAVAALSGRFRLGILSSGVGFVADWVRDDLGLEFAVANELGMEDGVFTGKSTTNVDLWCKDEALRLVAAERGLALERICFVGDHFNDLGAMNLVGLAIAANPKDDRLREAAEYTIDDFAVLPGLVDAYVQR
ncbi:HAD family phosphatase [Candidatus Bipolaricaulota bacterium]|nr:HAD family phosphatase [Candidatus Bipolaricaulota bacterium]